MSDGQFEIAEAVYLRWTVNSLGYNESHAFHFRSGEWRLQAYGHSYRQFYGGNVLGLSKISGVCRGPFRISVKVESGTRRRIVPELSEERQFTSFDFNNSRYNPVWEKTEDVILQAIPEFSRNRILQFIIVLKSEVGISSTASAGSQTKCSIPEGFEVGCMQSLYSDLGELFDQEVNTDVVFECSGQTVRGHSTILCARSAVIAAMLASPFIEGRTRVVTIRDTQPDIFKSFIKYLYTAQIPELREDSAIALYELGDRYAVHGLSRRCARYLMENISVENSLQLLVVADRHHDGDFKDNVIRYMVQSAVPEINDQWSSFYDYFPGLADEVIRQTKSSK